MRESGLFTTPTHIPRRDRKLVHRSGVIKNEGTLICKGLKMPEIGLSRGKSFVISAYADFGHDHLVFARQQSQQLKTLDWERTPPLKSWSSLMAPWVGLAGLMAITLPFVM